jgi:hypothetical protein
VGGEGGGWHPGRCASAGRDRLRANGVARWRRLAARRKVGGLCTLPSADCRSAVGRGATSRGSPELKPTGKRWGPRPKTQRGVLRPNKLVAFRHSPGRPAPKKVLAAPARRALLARRRQHAAGSTGCACRWLCTANPARSAQMGPGDRRTPSFFGIGVATSIPAPKKARKKPFHIVLIIFF